MTKRFSVFILAALLVFGFAQVSHAALGAVGPVDPANGFPSSYTDTNARALGPCLDIFSEVAVNQGCIPFVAEPGIFDPAQPIAFPNNFPSELFYWIATPAFDAITDPTGAVIVIEFALEGAFAGGPPLANDQIVFQRKRVRVNVPIGGTITVDHPFGTDTFTDGVAPDGAVADGVINVTDDQPAGIPLDFNGAVTANLIGPFLVANPLPAALPGYIGNFAVPQLVTGSPIRNNIAVSGDVNVTTDQWFVAGKIATPVVGLSVSSATYSRGSVALLGGHVEVVATSTAVASVLSLSGGPNLPLAPVPMASSGAGKYFASIPLSDASILPATVTVTGTLAGPPPVTSTVNAPLTDMVSITRAEYNTSSQSLIIEAASSDQQGAPVLTAFDTVAGTSLGTLVGGSLTVPLLGTPPDIVRVNSSFGGVARSVVDVTTFRLRLVDYTASTDTWNLRGNSTMPPGTPVNAFLTRTGQLIGSRNVRANGGRWIIPITGRGIIPQPGDTVTFQSAGDEMIVPARILP